MVQTTAPLFSISAAGTIARTLTYGHNRSSPFVRYRSMPVDRHSQKQGAFRSAMRLLSNRWPTLTQIWKDKWNAKPLSTSLSPFHAFTRFNMLRFRQQLPFSKQPTIQALMGHPVYDAPTIANVNGRVVLTINLTSGKGAWGIYLWRNTSTSVPRDLEHCIGVFDFEHERTYTFTDTPTEPGHYYYQFRPFRVRGFWSPLLPELDIEV